MHASWRHSSYTCPENMFTSCRCYQRTHLIELKMLLHTFVSDKTRVWCWQGAETQTYSSTSLAWRVPMICSVVVQCLPNSVICAWQALYNQSTCTCKLLENLSFLKQSPSLPAFIGCASLQSILYPKDANAGVGWLSGLRQSATTMQQYRCNTDICQACVLTQQVLHAGDVCYVVRSTRMSRYERSGMSCWLMVKHTMNVK